MPPITSFDGPHRFLSNFHPCGVTLGGERYPSVEHAYQAAKTLNDIGRETIRCCKSAGAAKRLGRCVSLRPGWDKIKLAVMMDLLRQKFSDPELKRLLLATGDAELIEGNTWGDTYWGVCDGKGENWLGRLLMQAREELQNDGAASLR